MTDSAQEHRSDMRRDNTNGVIARWLGRSGFAVADQSLLSATTFALNILFARWMSPQEFGEFAVEMSCILLIGSVQNALVLEPMTVFGAQKYRVAVDTYVRKLLLLQLAAFAALGAGAGALAESGGWVESPRSVLLFALALCTILLFWFVRRRIYLETLPHLALATTAAFAASSTALALLWRRQSGFLPADALEVQSAAYLFLRSMERPHGEFWSQLSASVATFTIGIAAGVLAGLGGLTAALVMARSAALVVALRLLRREMAKLEHSRTIGGIVPNQAR